MIDSSDIGRFVILKKEYTKRISDDKTKITMLRDDFVGKLYAVDGEYGYIIDKYRAKIIALKQYIDKFDY